MCRPQNTPTDLEDTPTLCYRMGYTHDDLQDTPIDQRTHPLSYRMCTHADLQDTPID